jgi:hypothetical protein
MKLSEILRAGKANIERYGWCQGDELAIHGPVDGPCCAATAISGDAAIEAIKHAAGIGDTPIATWNDAPERTLAEVLAAYDKAITAAEEQEQGK